MFSALLILLPLSFINTLNIRSNRYRPLLNLFFWIFAGNFLFLIWLGARPIAQPFVLLGQLSSLIYFSYFILLMIIG